MGYSTSDLYYQPHEFGLTPVGTIDWTDDSYSFDMTAVWYDAHNRKLYWASDSGCSCPSPFEDFTTLDTASTGTKMDLYKYLDERLNHEMYGYDGSGSWSFTDEYRDGFRERLVGEVGQLKLKVFELDVAK